MLSFGGTIGRQTAPNTGAIALFSSIQKWNIGQKTFRLLRYSSLKIISLALLRTQIRQSHDNTSEMKMSIAGTQQRRNRPFNRVSYFCLALTLGGFSS